MNTELVIRNAKTPVERRREMLSNPVVMSALEPVERAVFMASTAKTIAEYESGQLAVDLRNALKWIAKDTGYRNTDETEFNYLVVRVTEILKRYYPNLTLKDFRMAFEMSLTGELDDFLPKGRDGQADRGHYQNFNADYVCKILNAYKSRRAWILKKANQALPKAVAETGEQEKQEYRHQTRKDLVDCYNKYRETGKMPDVSPIAEMLFYDILSRAGLAPEIVVTLDEQKYILQQTINGYAARGYLGDVRRLKESGTDAEEIQFRAYCLARKKALRKVFDQMIKDEQELTV